MSLRRTAALITTAFLTIHPVCATGQGLAGPYLAAVQASYRDDYVTAARYFVQAVAQDPQNPYLVQNAIINNVIAGEFDVAAPLARRMLELGTELQLAGLVLVADAFGRDDYEGAQALLEDPDFRLNPLLSGLLQGWAAVGAGNMEAAQTHMDALGGNPNFGPLGQYHKALALALVGNFDGAAAILNGDDAGPLRVNRASVIAHAQVLVQLDQREAALAAIDETPGAKFDADMMRLRDRIAAGSEVSFDYVTDANDGAAEVFLTLATALTQEEADRFALLYARLAQQIREDYVDAYLVSAEILDNQGQFELAIADYARIPKDAGAFLNAEIGRANALASADRPDDAIVTLKALSEMVPDNLRVHEALGDVLRREERYGEAAESYSRVIDQIDEPVQSDWRSFYVRGIAYERTDQWEKAEADFRKALELQPDHPLVLNYLGYSLVEKNLKIDEARDMIERAVAGDPDNGFITDSLGWVLYKLGQFEDAVPHMERAVELLPADPVINDHLGDVFWKVGRKNEAVFQWKRALSFNPEEADAERIRRKLDVGLDVVLEDEATATE